MSTDSNHTDTDQIRYAIRTAFYVVSKLDEATAERDKVQRRLLRAMRGSALTTLQKLSLLQTAGAQIKPRYVTVTG